MLFEIQLMNADGYFAYNQHELFTHASYRGLEVIGIRCLFYQEYPYRLTTVYEGNRYCANIASPESVAQAIQSFVDAILGGQASFDVG